MDITINLMDSVSGTSTNMEGCTLFAVISKELESNNTIRLSLKDATPMSSSFMNSSFGELVDRFGMETFKNNIRLINYTPSQAEYIKHYLTMVSVKN